MEIFCVAEALLERVMRMRQQATTGVSSEDGVLGASERIVFDQEISGGRPRIAGTRLRVSDVLSMLAAGASQAEILDDFPSLTSDDISAALVYAAMAVEHRVPARPKDRR